jgi:hypothetical protein
MPDRQRDPGYHAERTRARLQQLIDQLREDAALVEEPQLKAIFETSAEVLGALIKTFDDYQRRNEAAWRP